MDNKYVKYFIVGVKGFLMGAADAIPGVSGGTIALVTGIYKELIESISNIDFNLFRNLKNDSFPILWRKYNINFLLPLIIGIFIGFLTLINIVSFMLENFSIQTWSFLNGLVIASGLIVLRNIKTWNILILLFLIIGFFSVIKISSIQINHTDSSLLYLFFVGAIGICAMLLPGISGALILLILGAYKTLKNSITDLNFLNLAFFFSGALFGIISFSKIIKWFLKKKPNISYGFLSGLILGSLNKLWPWKSTIKVLNRKTLEIIDFSKISNVGTLSVFQKINLDSNTFEPVLEENISPQVFSAINNKEPSHLLESVIFVLVGFLFVIMLEQVSFKLQKNK